MESGKLDKRITLQANVPTKNSDGEYVDTYIDVATVWAAVEPLSGNRYFQAQQANSDVSGVVRIRYRADVKPTMRIQYIGRYFKIVSVINPNEAKKELHILYKEALD